MDSQYFVNALFGAGLMCLGWFARELWAAVKELKNDLAQLRQALPTTYVSRDDYREDIREIKALLSKIFDKIEKKVDK
jgi:hypothetical protein